MPYFQDKTVVVDKLKTQILNYFLQADFRGEAIYQVDTITKQAVENFLREIDQISWLSGDRSDSAGVTSKPEITPSERLRLSQRGTPLRARLDYLRQIVGILSHGVLINPSVFMWKTLLQDFSFPYIKREIFTKNPVSEPNILSAYEITANCGYPIELIRVICEGRDELVGCNARAN